ncbi:MAG: hypothetical protein NTU54_05105 [Candidatus Omnitrophica bacterium]|nr:hypothetical protein [Candidatus Omnitrophota bacterium]
MSKSGYKSFSWDFFTLLFVAVYSTLSFARWPLQPQFIDIYYHLHTAWGFLQAGGYSSWDFWQYAPFGRVHIYPPFLHIVLAFFIKLGVDIVFLAKISEALTPSLFLFTVWYFVRRHFGRRLGFFSVFAFGSSFSFFLSLFNNIPATFAIILGILAADCLLRGRLLRCALLLALSYYTHIGAPWVFALAIIIFGLLEKGKAKVSFAVVLCAIIIALPVLLRELLALKSIQLTDMPDRYFCEFKVLDYILALLGVIIAVKKKGKYYLFVSLFLASFIFLLYPYRFFSAQGFLPIIFFSAILLDSLYEKLATTAVKMSAFFIFFGFFILLFSPTLLTERAQGHESAKLYLFDSVLHDMLLPLENRRIASTSLWNPDEYIRTSALIKKYSRPNDIIYANYHILSACLATLSGRANASALFPEIDPVKHFSPFRVARIIVLTKDNSPAAINYVVAKYKLRFLGENRLLIIFSNPLAKAEFIVPKPCVPFWVIGMILLIFAAVFILEDKIMPHNLIKKYLT